MKVQALLDAGIGTFINLTEPTERGLNGQPFVPYEPTVFQLSMEFPEQPQCVRFVIRDQWIQTVDMSNPEVVRWPGGNRRHLFGRRHLGRLRLYPRLCR